MPNTVNPIAPNSGNLDAVMALPMGASKRWLSQLNSLVQEIGWSDWEEAAACNCLFCVDKNDRPHLIPNVAEIETQSELFKAGAEGRLFMRPKNGEGLVQFLTTVGEPEPGPDYSDRIMKPEVLRVLEEERELTRLKVQRTEPLREVPLLPAEAPPFWKYLLFPFFLPELWAYHKVSSRNDQLTNGELGAGFRNDFASAVRAHRDANAQQVREILNEVIQDRSIDKTIATCRAYANGAKELDPDADLGENEDAWEGLTQVRDAFRRGMQEKFDLMQDIVNGRPMAPSRAQLAERLSRVMVAEHLMHSVQMHNLDCRQRGVNEVNPLYEAAGDLGDLFDQMEEKLVTTNVVAQMAQMTPIALLRLFSHPTEMAQKVNTMIAEKNSSWNMDAPQMENALENQNPQADMAGPNLI